MYVSEIIGPNVTTGHYVTANESQTENVCFVHPPISDDGQPVSYWVPDPLEEKPLASRGDGVHATPYSARFCDVIPVKGTLSSTASYEDSSDTLLTELCGPGPYVYNRHKRSCASVGTFTELSFPDQAEWVSFLKEMSLTSANADLRRSFNNIPLLIVERRQTVQLLAQKARQLSVLISAQQRKALLRYGRAAKDQKKRVSRDIANEHLAFLFGVLPLVDEATGLVDNLTKTKSSRLTGRGRRAKMWEEDETIELTGDSPVALGSGYSFHATVRRKSLRRLSCRSSVSVTIESQGAQTMRDWGFNPLAAVYDIVPLSFLSEFVSNLGTFIRSFDPLIGVTFLTGNVSLWQEVTQNVSVDGGSKSMTWGSATGKVTTSGSGAGYYRQLAVDREVLTDFPESSVHFANNMSLGKAITLAALGIQRSIKPAKKLIALRQFRFKGPRPANLPPITYR